MKSYSLIAACFALMIAGGNGELAYAGERTAEDAVFDGVFDGIIDAKSSLRLIRTDGKSIDISLEQTCSWYTGRDESHAIVGIATAPTFFWHERNILWIYLRKTDSSYTSTPPSIKQMLDAIPGPRFPAEAAAGTMMVMFSLNGSKEDIWWKSLPGGTATLASQGGWPAIGFDGVASVTLALSAVPMQEDEGPGKGSTGRLGSLSGTISLRVGKVPPPPRRFWRPLHMDPVERVFNGFMGLFFVLLGSVALYGAVIGTSADRSWSTALFGLLIGIVFLGYGLLAIMGYVDVPGSTG